MKSMKGGDNSNNSDNKVSKVMVTVIAVATVVILLMMLINLVRGYSDDQKYNPFLVEGTRQGKKSLIVPGKNVYPSMDGQYGQEFTYAMWLYVEDSNFTGSKGSKMKHVFHRGNPQGNPMQAPGVWIYPYDNKLAINMNTFYSIKESCDIGNIPVNKWFHLSVMLIGQNLDVYVNCELKKRCKLKGVPKMNYGDIYITNWEGFDGLISNMRYFNRALQTHEMETLCSLGPSKGGCTDPSEKPPYLSDDYYLRTGFPEAVGFPDNERKNNK